MPGTVTPGEISASRLLHSFLFCALDRSSVANAVYGALREISNNDYLATLDEIEKKIQNSPADIVSQLRTQPLTHAEATPARNFASNVFRCLCVGIYNPSSKASQPSIAPPPDPNQLRTITQLLHDSVERGT
ncbi:hypothetical protein FRB94_005746 [Tulasnella sp. JGI-2019a]|nr:hypothetical protein FRB94_005746 [Tulasnella sp. JGI-2019a]